ncbi:MAG: PAS domain S-box protein, partial [Candidatus Tectomicrobia bacterium]|nr:PAS domain S-box protein [Candidatus Tectomicrobia bacterium]
LGTRLVGARYGALGVLNARGDALSHFITTGIDEKTRAALGSLPQGGGLLGVLIRDPRPLRLKDVHKDPRSAGFPEGHPPMRSFLGIPLTSHGKVCGSFYFTEKQGAPEFRAADERLAETFARFAVKAIEHPIASAGVRRSLDVFRSALDEKADAIIIMNPAREIILWNDGARDLFGFTEEEALGRGFVDLLVPAEDRGDWRARDEHRLARDLQEGKEVRFEAMRLQKDGGRIPVSVTLSPILHNAAGIMAITGIYKMTKILTGAERA